MSDDLSHLTDAEDEAYRLHRIERERKRVEVRRRLEEDGWVRRAKKGFFTPERKKCLRRLLMQRATEDLKRQQQLESEERHRILHERIVVLPDDIDMLNDRHLIELAEYYISKVMMLEEEVFELGGAVRLKDHLINELNISVNHLRGKYAKPTLKRVPKMETQFYRIKKQAVAKMDFRSKLRAVEVHRFAF